MLLHEDSEKLQRLEVLFARLFSGSEQAVLVRALTSDPVYFPKSELRDFNEIHFANEFFSSALHEIAHWLIAGCDRRTRIDFGYWYKPDGRNPAEQELFEQFEARNQGLEWILSVAADHNFHVSTDNLSGGKVGGESFAQAVRTHALLFLRNGLSGRCKVLVDGLISEFSDPQKFNRYWFVIENEQILPPY